MLSTSVVLERATYEIPPDTPHPEFVVPTEVTDFIIKEYGLADPRIKVIDPFLGNADFLDRVRNKGGRCDGIELDPRQYKITTDRISLHEGMIVQGRLRPDSEIRQGDSMVTPTRLLALGYNAIYTSPPFTMIHDLAHNYLDKRLARALNAMLHSGDGVLIIDSADSAVRDGKSYSPAADTVNYLTKPAAVYPGAQYADAYFNLRTSHRFTVNNPPEGCDDQFTELVFSKRWPYYPGALADLAVAHTLDRRSLFVNTRWPKWH